MSEYSAAITRRSILGAGLNLLGAQATAAAAELEVAAQTYIWLLHFEREKLSIEQGAGAAFAGIREAGFRNVELMPPFVEAGMRERTRSLLKQHSLRPTVVFASGPLYDEARSEATGKRILETAEVAADLGALWINYSPVAKPGEAAKTAVELDRQTAAVIRLAEAVERLGMRLMVHNHSFEMKDGAREWRWLLRHTPEDVGFCVDPSWMLLGGQNPMRLIREARRRIAALHLRNLRSGSWLESLDAGDLDWSSIASTVLQAGFRGTIVVELVYDERTSVSRKLTENLRLSRLAAERIFRAARA